MESVSLFDGDEVSLQWGEAVWSCQVYRSEERCAMCGGPTVRIEPPWESWNLLCVQESALTTTPAQRDAAAANLSPDAIGIVSSVPVKLRKLD